MLKTLVYLTGVLLAAAGLCPGQVTFTEYPLPTSRAYPSRIAAGPDGNLWFTENGVDKIGRITTAGSITEFSLSNGVSPQGIAAGPDGNLWFAEVDGNKIGRITPAGVITEFSVPTVGGGPSEIAAGPDGNLWFTEAYGNKIGKITTAGVITEFAGNGTPGWIAKGSDGNLWFTEIDGNRIARITPAGVVTEYSLPASFSLPTGITPGPDGNLWFGESNGKLGRITTAGVITEYQFSSYATVQGIAAGPDGNLWFADYLANRIGKSTTAGAVTEYTIPTGSSGPSGITVGPDGNLWFTENVGNQIGRIAIGSTPGCTLSLTVNPSSNIAMGGGSGSIAVSATCAWTASSNQTWLHITAGSSGSGNGTILWTADANAGAASRNASITVNQTVQAFVQAGTQALPAPTLLAPTCGASNVPLSTTLSWSAVAGAAGYDVYLGTSYPPANVASAQSANSYAVSLLPAKTYYWQVGVSGGGSSSLSQVCPFSTTTSTVAALRFVPIAPCRAVDTRAPATYPISGATLADGEQRSFVLPSSACGIPAGAAAYSLNATVVPQKGKLGYLALWPSDKARPLASTLNSLDGRIRANAAIVPAAATDGSISAYVTDSSDLIFDINGYFEAPGVAPSALAFYPVTPCRLADTRSNAPVSPIGAGTKRDFAINGVKCGIPATALAYSLNVTAVPRGTLGYITLWPLGLTQPFASTLNAPTGQITANAALVQAGTGGVSVYASDSTDIVLDINGYFAAPGTGGMSLYTVTPCRVADTRDSSLGAFGTPALAAKETRTYAVPQSSCAPPSTAKAWALNATVVPSGSQLGYLALWPADQTQPLVSTLNSPDGAVLANMAIVPGAAANGSIKAFVTDATDLIFDLYGYFAP